MKRVVISLFAIVIIISCKNIPVNDSIINAINQSEYNKQELKKAAKIFSRPKDSLKQKSMFFLLENMDNHFSFNMDEAKDFDKIYSIFSNRPRDHKDAIIDSLIKAGITPLPLYIRQLDKEFIKAEFLKKQINLAFQKWNMCPWSNKYSFDQFCQYILPYRINDGLKLENWRNKFENYDQLSLTYNEDIQKLVSLYSLIYKEIRGNFYNTVKTLFPSPISLENCYTGKVGLCSDACNYFVAVARSAGLPVVTDFTPAWGNFRMGHTWNALLMPDGSLTYHLRLEDKPKCYKGMVHAMRDFDYDKHHLIYSEDELENNVIIKEIIEGKNFITHLVNTSFIPETQQIFKQKKLGKIFRNMYAVQKESLAYQEHDSYQIPDFFKSQYLKDVTSEYLNTVNCTISVDTNIFKYVFLCLFQKEGFVPIAWAKVDSLTQKAVFTDLGDEVLYFPMYYNFGKYEPAQKPFILSDEGKPQYIFSDETKNVNIMLYRKSPLRLRSVYYANFMLNGKFQASNDPDFKNSTDLYIVNRTPLSWVNADIKNSNKYRYIRYVNKGNSSDIGEIKVYCKNKSNIVEIENPKIISKGKFNNAPLYAFDGNLTTFCRASDTLSWFGIDLGKPMNISIIRFYPRFDSNEILPDQRYELKYWKDGWVSLGIKKAQSGSLEYKNVPYNALFWLTNLSGGREERPFTYDNIQKWW